MRAVVYNYPGVDIELVSQSQLLIVEALWLLLAAMRYTPWPVSTS